MEELLIPVSTSYRHSNQGADDFLIELPKALATTPQESVQISTAESALDALRREPDYPTFAKILRFIVPNASAGSSFRITRPSPLTAQLVNVLVSETVPRYWPVLNEEQENLENKLFKQSAERKLLLASLRSVTGINAILAQLKALIQQEKEGKRGAGVLVPGEDIGLYLDLLEAVLQGNKIVRAFWNDVVAESITTQKVLWREIVLLIGGGKILNVAAESASIFNDLSLGIQRPRWLADGQLYSRWLASNILQVSGPLRLITNGSWKPLSELLSKCFRLAYSSRSRLYEICDFELIHFLR